MSRSATGKVTLSELIDTGKVKVGTPLVFHRRDGSVAGKIVETGAIKVGRKEYPTPTAAAKAVAEGEINGWVAWKVKETNETLASLRTA